MTSGSRYLALLPLTIGLSYLALTYGLFILSPFAWPIFDYTPLNVVLLLTVLAIWIGFSIGCNIEKSVKPKPVPVQQILLIGSIAAIVLLIPSSYVYAGRWPWQFFEALSDQRGAYLTLAEQISGSSLERLPIIFLRTFFSPFIFAVLPLGIIYWSKVGNGLRALIVATAMCSIIFSVLRGTTRELADLFIISLSAFLVIFGRRLYDSNTSTKLAFRQLFRISFISITAIFIILSTLSFRTGERLGIQEQTCLGYSLICADNQSVVDEVIPDALYMPFATVSAYLGQGYYGLSLALDRDFVSSLGVGHSPALRATVDLFVDVDPLYANSYTYRNYLDRWSDEYQWSTGLTWIANDIGMPGAIVFVFLVAVVFGWSWVRSTKHESDAAAVVFCMGMIFIFYLPANNQLFTTLDSYFAVVCWTYVALRRG